jgi:hypothetical protein
MVLAIFEIPGSLALTSASIETWMETTKEKDGEL